MNGRVNKRLDTEMESRETVRQRRQKPEQQKLYKRMRLRPEERKNDEIAKRRLFLIFFE